MDDPSETTEEQAARDEGGKFEYSEWYEENKHSLNEKKRKKYAEDEEAREKQKARARDWNRRQAEKKRLAREARPGNAQIRRPRKPKVVKVGGEEIEMYTVGTLARAIGKTSQTISSWERKGFIPTTPFRSNDIRLYSQGMIEAIDRALKEVGVVKFGDSRVHDLVTQMWSELGVSEGVQYEVAA